MSSEPDHAFPNAMYRFHATLHAQPPDAARGSRFSLNGFTLHPLEISPAQRSTTFPISFEQAYDNLLQLRQLFIEGDGSFYWMTADLNRVWFLDGNLYDRDERLVYVDVKGTCPREEFDQFLAALGWPNTRIMFQLVHAAVFLDEADFRRWSAQ